MSKSHMSNTASMRRTTRQMNLLENMDNNYLSVKQKVPAVEKDSGVYDPLSVNYSRSTCSGMASATSPNTTSSSAYSSVISSCCDSSRFRPEASVKLSPLIASSSRVPHHPKVTDALPSESNCFRNIGTVASVALPSTSHPQLRSRGCSATSTKSDQSIAEDSRFLYNVNNCKIYEKRRLLGKGGFAKVYEVSEVDQDGNALSEETYAAKIINKSRITRPQQREKVDIEVELMAELSGHPNVLNFIDSFEDENSVCILLEICNKKSLAQYLRRKQYLSEPEVCHIMQQIVLGLSHLHDQGIIHRDLKLGNILLTENMQAKIGDFGLATRVEWGRKKTICGTPNFIAPEVLQRQGHGPESDVWALGCLLYTLLVGKPPFETASLRDTYRCILKNSYRIPSTISAEAASLIRSMLHPKPKARPNLAEVSSHAFFKKHATQLFQSFQNRSESSNAFLEPCSRKNSEFFLKPAENLIEQGKTAIDTVCTEPSQIKSSTNTRKSVKKLASRLFKKLRKATTKKMDPPSHEHVTEEKTTNKTSPSTWVNKWVDYSNRYGFGYQLSNGKICVLFNDGSHIALLPAGNVIEFVSGETAQQIRFSADAVPSCLLKYANILHNFTNYMDNNLRPSQQDVSFNQDKDGVRLLTWCRTEQYVAMHFNDGTLQVNFTNDHVKVNITSLHNLANMHVTYVNPARKFQVFTSNEFETLATVEMKEKMNIIYQQFHSLFVDAEPEM